MAYKLCLLLLVAAHLLGGRAISAEGIAGDTVQQHSPLWVQLGLGVGMMTEKTGLLGDVGVWTPMNWPLLGVSFNYCGQINFSFDNGSRHGDEMGDFALLAGVRDLGNFGWLNFAIGPAYFWETRWYATDDHADFSGAALKLAASFGGSIGNGGLGLSVNVLIGSETQRLAICLVGEIPISD